MSNTESTVLGLGSKGHKNDEPIQQSPRNRLTASAQEPPREVKQHRVGTAAQAVSLLHFLIQDGQTQQSLKLAEKAVNTWPTDIPLLRLAAQMAQQIGRNVAAMELYARAKNLGDEHAAHSMQALIDEAAPYWHFRMMNDEVRNDAYDAAIKYFVKPNSVVLDIGCGAGLLSMMAARAGAEHVYACEVHELMHYKAQKVFEANRFSDRITAFHSISNDLEVGKQLPRKADIVVAEVFDSGLLGEQALATFEHARKHLLAPGGRLIPGKASIQAQLIESELMHKEAVSHWCAGFDVSELNSLAPSYFQIRINTHEHRFLSAEETVLRFDFERDEELSRSSTHEFVCTHNGLCHGVAFWFTLDFCQGTLLSTGPENEWNCWMQAMCAFEKPVNVVNGQVLRVRLIQTSNRVRFTIADD